MALSKENMRRIANGAIVTAGTTLGIWHLATNDADTVVEAANYFDLLVDRLQVGDLILGALDLDGTPEIKTYIVATNDGTTVTVAAMPVL